MTQQEAPMNIDLRGIRERCDEGLTHHDDMPEILRFTERLVAAVRSFIKAEDDLYFGNKDGEVWEHYCRLKEDAYGNLRSVVDEVVDADARSSR